VPVVRMSKSKKTVHLPYTDAGMKKAAEMKKKGAKVKKMKKM
jgi:hypothetical protein